MEEHEGDLESIGKAWKNEHNPRQFGNALEAVNSWDQLGSQPVW